MLKRHEDALMQRFDAVARLGFAQIEWWELYLWYNQQRIGKTIWRDLKSRFEEVADDDTAELHIYSGETCLLLIHSDRLENISGKIGGAE